MANTFPEQGNVGIGITNPQRSLHVEGVIRVDRGGDSSGLLISRTAANDTPQKVFGVLVDSRGSNNGVFRITDFGTNVGGGSKTRLLIDNDGNVEIPGTMTTNNVASPSDLRYKEDISTLPDALNKVLKMRGVSYNLKQEEFSEKAFSQDSQIGFIGQEVENICPEVVFTDSEGYKSLDYSRLTPVLVEAIKEQQQLIQHHQSALSEALDKIGQLEDTVKKLSV